MLHILIYNFVFCRVVPCLRCLCLQCNITGPWECPSDFCNIKLRVALQLLRTSVSVINQAHDLFARHFMSKKFICAQSVQMNGVGFLLTCFSVLTLYSIYNTYIISLYENKKNFPSSVMRVQINLIVLLQQYVASNVDLANMLDQQENANMRKHL